MWRGMTYFRKKGDDEGHGKLNAPTSTESDSYHESTGAHAPQPNPPNPKKRPGTDPDLDRGHRANLEDPQPPGPAPPKRPNYKNQVGHVQQPNPRPSNPGYGSSRYWSLGFLEPNLADALLKFKTWNPPIPESSEVHASPSSAPSGSHHGSANVVQAPASNPASSTANPHPMMELPGPSAAAAAAAAMQGSWENRFTRMPRGMTNFRIKATMGCICYCAPWDW
jgi:hypothetical protein